MAEEIGESTAPTLAEQYADVVQYLQDLETVERTRSLPQLADRWRSATYERQQRKSSMKMMTKVTPTQWPLFKRVVPWLF